MPDVDEAREAGRDDDAIDAYVRRVVASAPPLSEEQRRVLAALLAPRGGGRVGG
jgi:hypothetical protein